MNLNKLKVFQPTQESSGEGSSGTANSDYTRTLGIAVSIGGLSAGHVPTGTVQDLLDRMLYPYQTPSFSAFQINGQSTLLELGESIAPGNKTFSWGTTNAGNITANTIIIKDTTNNQILGSALANDGSEVLSIPASIFKTNNATHSFSIQAINTQGSNLSRSFDINWRPRRFAGTIPASSLVALQSATSITGLNSVPGIAITLNDLTYAKPGTATYNCSGSADGKYIWFLWDAALGTASFFSGAAPAAFRAAQTVLFSNSFGVGRNYYLYISSNPFNGSAVPITVS